MVESSPVKGSNLPFKEQPGKLTIDCVHVISGTNLVIVDSSLLTGKTLPPFPRTRKVDAAETTLQEQHDTEQEWQEANITDLATDESVKAAEEIAEKPGS